MYDDDFLLHRLQRFTISMLKGISYTTTAWPVLDFFMFNSM